MKLMLPKRRESPFSWELALPEDLAKCVELALESYSEQDPDLSPAPVFEDVWESLNALINQKLVILYKNNGVACGLLALYLGTEWWSQSSQRLKSAIFYIKPDFRSFRAFGSALRQAEAYAKLNRVPLDFFFYTAKDVKRKFKLFKRKGYTPQGFLVTKLFK